MKAIINGKIILSDRIVENAALLYTDTIKGIIPCDKLPEDVEIIDAKGGYVSPGFIVLHTPFQGTSSLIALVPYNSPVRLTCY